MQLKNHVVMIVLLATSFTAAEAALAADWPLAAPQVYRAGTFLPVEWTGLYFGVNAGYGWAQGSTDTFFTGAFQGGTTTPFGAGLNELGTTKLHGSGNPSGAIAGGQIGFNWQAGMFVFGAEMDAQWSGQQSSFTVVCTSGCSAAEHVRIKSILTGRARLGVAFDWIMPYVTAGAALVNAGDDLTVTAGGVSGTFQSLSASTLGWAVGAGVDMALTSNWSVRLEYLHIKADDLSTTVPMPNALGLGTASEGSGYSDNMVRVGLNYRFGPRGGPGVLEPRLTAPGTYASAYDFLPSVPTFAGNVRSEKRPQAAPVVAQTIAQQPARAPAPVAVAVKSEARQKSALNNLDEVEGTDGTATLSAEPRMIKLPSLKQRQKADADDDTQRLKRIMSICTAC
jgi:outer membrane immunogenic protein